VGDRDRDRAASGVIAIEWPDGSVWVVPAASLRGCSSADVVARVERVRWAVRLALGIAAP
jgi:hypothetical protein